MSDNPKRSDSLSFAQAYGIYGSAGFQLALSVVLGVMAGHWLDQKLATKPWFLVGGVVLGTVAGFVNLFRLVGSCKTQDKK